MYLMLIVGLTVAFLGGCDKKEPAAEPQSQLPTIPQSLTEKVQEALEQTHCPVMNQPIDKRYFVEYEGKKVYFCCPGCESKFNEEPEKYIPELPQFKN